MLSDNGVAVFNHLGDNVFKYNAFDALSEFFPHNLFAVPVDVNNTILLASKGLVPEYLDQQFLSGADALISLPCKFYFENMYRIF